MKVELYIYDLSQGTASQFSGLLGFQLEAIWHTSVVVFGHEWFFGSSGIQQSLPAQTMLGRPLRIEDMGNTQIDLHMFRTRIIELSHDRFRGERYRLLEHNCNTFSNELCLFLTNKSIPNYILELPRRVLQSPLGSMIAPALEALNPSGSTINDDDHDQKCHIPSSETIKYVDKVKIEAMSKKIRSLGKSEAELALLTNLLKQIESGIAINEDAWLQVCKLMDEWPVEHCIALFDVLRFGVAVKKPSSQVQRKLMKGAIKVFKEGKEREEDFKVVMVAAKMAANVVSVKNNAMSAEDIFDLVEELNNGLVDKLFSSSASKALTALSAFIVNITSTVVLDESSSIAILDLLLSRFLSHAHLVEEMAYLVVVAVGNLAVKYDVAKDASLAMDAVGAVQRVDGVSPRVAEAVAQCHDKINN